MSQESLRAEQASREIFMYKYLVHERYYVTRVVKSFPGSSTNEFHLNTASDSIQLHRRVEFPDGQRVNIRECVGAGMGTARINNCTKDVLVIRCRRLEVRIISLNTTLKAEKILVVQLIRAELALI